MSLETSDFRVAPRLFDRRQVRDGCVHRTGDGRSVNVRNKAPAGHFGAHRAAGREGQGVAVGTLTGAVAAAHLADDYRGPDGLFGPPVGGVYRRVPQEEERGREFVGEMLGKALGVFQRRRRVDQPTEPGLESAAERVETVPG